MSANRSSVVYTTEHLQIDEYATFHIFITSDVMSMNSTSTLVLLVTHNCVVTVGWYCL